MRRNAAGYRRSPSPWSDREFVVEHQRWIGAEASFSRFSASSIRSMALVGWPAYASRRQRHTARGHPGLWAGPHRRFEPGELVDRADRRADGGASQGEAPTCKVYLCKDRGETRRVRVVDTLIKKKKSHLFASEKEAREATPKIKRAYRRRLRGERRGGRREDRSGRGGALLVWCRRVGPHLVRKPIGPLHFLSVENLCGRGESNSHNLTITRT